METKTNPRARNGLEPRWRWLWQILSCLFAAACLYWVFRGVPFSGLVKSIARIELGWVAVAAALDVMVYFCAAWEWQLLLRPIGSLTLPQTLQAVFAGRFANDVLPVHAGYLLRLYLASRWSGKSISSVIPSLLTERLLDGVWLALGIGLTILFFPLPPTFARSGGILGGLILTGIAVVTWAVVRKSTRASSKHGILARLTPAVVRSFVHHLAEGVQGIGRSRLLLAAVAISIAKLLFQALAFLSLLWAYRFSLPLDIQLAIFFITYLGISLPSTPAGMGVFQVICAFSLRFFGIPKAVAGSFALVAYVVLTAPLALGGVIAIATTGLSLRQIRREIHQ